MPGARVLCMLSVVGLKSLVVVVMAHLPLTYPGAGTRLVNRHLLNSELRQ